jgi:hypothetical protein
VVHHSHPAYQALGPWRSRARHAAGTVALQKSVTALFMMLAESEILVQNSAKFPFPQLRATFLHE